MLGFQDTARLIMGTGTPGIIGTGTTDQDMINETVYRPSEPNISGIFGDANLIRTAISGRNKRAEELRQQREGTDTLAGQIVQAVSVATSNPFFWFAAAGVGLYFFARGRF